LQELHEDTQLKDAQALSKDGGLSEIRYHQLDITDSKSIQTFAEHLRQAHGDGIDFVINNAGIALQGFDSNVVKVTLGCNYYSTLEACHKFLPLIKPGGRLVNVASMSGKLNKYSDEIRNRFLSSKTEADVTSIMEDFAAAVEAGKEKEAGFPSAAYATSKAGLIGATRALAKAEEEKGGTVLINSCCPGYVKTDMTRGGGAKTPDQGAQTPVMLAIADLQGQSGFFWQEEKHLEW
jgi:carbonyl reductase 1